MPYGLASDFWGATWWYVIKSCCTHGSNEELQRELVVDVLPSTLPCGLCRGHYRNNVAALVTSGPRPDPARLLCFIHNLVNRSRKASCAQLDHYAGPTGRRKYQEWFGSSTLELKHALRFFFRFVVEAFPETTTWDGGSRKRALLRLIELVQSLLPCVLFDSSHIIDVEAEKASVASSIDLVLGPYKSRPVYGDMRVFHSTSNEVERIDQFVWLLRSQPNLTLFVD